MAVVQAVLPLPLIRGNDAYQWVSKHGTCSLCIPNKHWSPSLAVLLMQCIQGKGQARSLQQTRNDTLVQLTAVPWATRVQGKPPQQARQREHPDNLQLSNRCLHGCSRAATTVRVHMCSAYHTMPPLLCSSAQLNSSAYPSTHD